MSIFSLKFFGIFLGAAVTLLAFNNCGKYVAGQEFSSNPPELEAANPTPTGETPPTLTQDSDVPFSTSSKFSSVAIAPGQMHERPRGSTGFDMGYLEYLPAGYDDDMNKKWPLMVFFAGGGEIGNGTTDLGLMTVHGPLRRVNQGRHFPAVIIAPQMTEGSHFQGENFCNLLDYLAANYRVDRKRIYATGLSYGGMALWLIAQSCPAKLAAIAPISAPYFVTVTSPTQRPAYQLYENKIPTWVLNAQDDSNPSVNIAEADKGPIEMGALLRLTNGLRDGNSQPTEIKTARTVSPNRWEWASGLFPYRRQSQVDKIDFRYTVFHAGDHGIWVQVYESENFWNWMFQQQKP